MADFRFLAPLGVLVGLLLFAPTASASHVHCGDLIAQDTTLDSDLVCSGIGAALTVTTSNVMLDLNGRTIEGSGTSSAGVVIVNTFKDDAFVYNPDDTVVRDGTISGFGSGIFAEDAARPTARKVVLKSNRAGFDCNRAPGCRIEDSTLRGNGVGIRMEYSSGGTVESATVSRNLFVDNGATAGSSGPALFLSGYPATVSDNRFVENERAGVYVEEFTAGDIALTNNVISGNGQEGVFVGFDGSATLSSNRIVRNGGAGVRLNGMCCGAAVAQIHDNVISRNAGDGIWAERHAEGLIRQNRTDRNGDDGIDVDPTDCCSNVTLQANRAFFNNDLGIEAVAGTTDGGGNRAKHNGNPAQCVGVTCK